jgi:hypothetical protein
VEDGVGVDPMTWRRLVEDDEYLVQYCTVVLVSAVEGVDSPLARGPLFLLLRIRIYRLR